MMFSSVFLFTVVMTELGAAFCYAGLCSSVIKAETPLLKLIFNVIPSLFLWKKNIK